MCYIIYEKWGKGKSERNRNSKSGKNQDSLREGRLKILGKIGIIHHQKDKDERRNNKTIPDKFYKRD